MERDSIARRRCGAKMNSLCTRGPLTASAALFMLFVTTILSVYKPWGMTEYGLRKQSEPGITWRVAATGDRRTGGGIPGRYGVLAIIVFVVLMLLLHLVTRGLHGH